MKFSSWIRGLAAGLMFVFVLPVAGNNPPDEGMWLPMLVERLNYVDMQKMGLRLTPEELYSINHSSLKDAIVGLSAGGASGGFFCTGEVVSDQGLVFTNHHCGYDAVATLSTPEHDYLTNGFWAMEKSQELSCEGMVMAFLVRVENVTDSIVPFLSDTLDEGDRNDEVRSLGNKLKKRAVEGTDYEGVVKSFYGGNEYYLFVYNVYKDIRLVGAPPSSVGKFGGDTDNWMWPRHTGDFSIFRIYADSAGNPAAYSENNVPLVPAHHLPVSLKGVKKNDFTMVWGYPGSTTRYLSSFGVNYNLNYFYPTLIDLLGKKLEIMKERMDKSDDIRLKYASSYASIANGWKNFIGQRKAIKRLKVADSKKTIEDQFVRWVSMNPEREKKYGTILRDLEDGYQSLEKVAVPFLYVNLGGMGLDIIDLASSSGELQTALEQKNKDLIRKMTEDFRQTVEAHYKESDLAVEKKTMTELLEMFATNVSKDQLPDIFQEIEKEYGNDFNAYTEYIYTTSIFGNREKMSKFLEKPNLGTLKKDPAFRIQKSMTQSAGMLSGQYGEAQTQIRKGNRYFIKGLMEMQPGKVFYPDANSTMRLSYGKVLDYYPADAVHYDYTTTIKGIMEKEDPENDEFFVEAKLKDLYQMKDYGQYGENGDLVVCFLSTNDITGGNSGSPVINGNGELIGLAFDGNWEAMSGDIIFQPDLQRTINVDIRYVLFIIDKFAGAKNIIDELTLVR